jgi:GTP-binding protein YchF
VHVTGKVDPVSDIETIHTELALADLASVDKQIAKVEKVARAGGDKEAKRLHDVLVKVQAVLDQGRPARTADLYEEEKALLKPFFLLTMKPTMYVANVDERGFHDNPLLDRVVAYAQGEGAPVVPVCAKLESEIADLDGDDKQAFLDDLGLDEPGLDRVIHAGYRLLGLQTYFTAGPKEVRAWTIHVGDTAPQAAGVIHTDFERGFIRAEVIPFADYLAHKGEHGAKEAGRMRLEGKEYVMHDGDVVHFRFNV